MFKCTIRLTDAGAQHWEQACALVLRYMRIMRDTPLDKLVALYAPLAFLHCIFVTI